MRLGTEAFVKAQSERGHANLYPHACINSKHILQEGCGRNKHKKRVNPEEPSKDHFYGNHPATSSSQKVFFFFSFPLFQSVLFGCLAH